MTPRLHCALACLGAAAALTAGDARAAPARIANSAAAAARIAPGAADAALLLGGADSLAGFRAFLETAGKHAPSLDPRDLGRMIESRLGVDLLSAAAPTAQAGGDRLPWGIGDGPRAAVLLGRTLGLTAPLAKGAEAAAKKALSAWLNEAGKPRRAGRSIAAGKGRSMRAGLIAPVQGGPRLLIATGAEADRLVELFALVGRGKRPLSRRPELKAALAQLNGPAALFVRGEGPVRAALLSLHGTTTELSADGLVLAQGGALLAGPPLSAAACGEGPLLCARAGLGRSGKALLSLVARQWADLALTGPRRDLFAKAIAAAIGALTGPAALRIETLDVERLGALSDPLWAAPFTAIGLQQGFNLGRDLPASLPAGMSRDGDGLTVEAARTLCLKADARRLSLSDLCPGRDLPTSPAADAEDAAAFLDLPLLGRELARASPLTALRGPLSAAAYTARLLLADLLAASEPITARARPAPSDAKAAQVEIAWRLRE